MAKDDMVSKTTGIIIILLSTMIFVVLGVVGVYVGFNYTDLFSDDGEVISRKLGKSKIVYPDEMSKILYNLEFLTEKYSSDCSIISSYWHNSIFGSRNMYSSRNISIDGAVEEAMKEIERIEAKGSMVTYNEEEMEESLELISNPPKEYEKAYDLVIESYGHYMNIYNLSKNPRGNYEMYVQDYTNSQSEVENNLKKITAMYRDIYIGASKSRK